ncbi:GIY-YIG nuclease family protein [Ilumatobacter sp.]|uniref:GIY-YIG nuclease family protein n=1 Tax=Ilumatobacter sp. TaxID=1967498 RepID=UPI003750278C
MADDGGNLNLGHILAAGGVTRFDDVMAIRHTYKTLEGIRTSADATPANLLAFTRHQDLRASKIPQQPANTWLIFMGDGARRSRFVCAYENRGEVLGERTADSRFFDLHESEMLAALRNRLVIEWPKDTINWAKGGEIAAAFPLVEIADPNAVPFPGFDRLLIPYEELVDVVADHRYSEWQAALSSVQGVYLIADSTNGKLYVGKADGRERILGRWGAYARDGHGGNVALRDLAQLDPSHARHFVFSILRVFGPSVIASEVDEAEAHYKRALLTRRPFGMNSN